MRSLEHSVRKGLRIPDWLAAVALCIDAYCSGSIFFWADKICAAIGNLSTDTYVYRRHIELFVSHRSVRRRFGHFVRRRFIAVDQFRLVGLIVVYTFIVQKVRYFFRLSFESP